MVKQYLSIPVATPPSVRSMTWFLSWSLLHTWILEVSSASQREEDPWWCATDALEAEPSCNSGHPTFCQEKVTVLTGHPGALHPHADFSRVIGLQLHATTCCSGSWWQLSWATFWSDVGRLMVVRRGQTVLICLWVEWGSEHPLLYRLCYPVLSHWVYLAYSRLFSRDHGHCYIFFSSSWTLICIWWRQRETDLWICNIMMSTPVSLQKNHCE